MKKNRSWTRGRAAFALGSIGLATMVAFGANARPASAVDLGAPAPGDSAVATALQDSGTGQYDALLTDLASMSGADMDAYLTQLGTSGRQHLNAGLEGRYVPILTRATLTEAMLTKASKSTIQASKKDLAFWQPDLDTSSASTRDVTWPWNLPKGTSPAATPPLFSDGGRPSVQDVSQGYLPDCYFHAELLAIVQTHREWITSHIVANNNGTVTVTFYQDGKAVPVTITTDLPQESNGGSAYFPYGGTGTTRGGGDSSVATATPGTTSWMALYEKAYAQLLGGYPVLNGETILSPQSRTGAAYGALTGRTLTRVGGLGLWPSNGWPWSGDIGGSLPSLQQISQWLSVGEVVTTATFPKGGGDNGLFPVTVTSQDPGTSGQQLQGVAASHEYTVASVDTASNTLTLLNPWGPGAKNYGVGVPFKITITAANYQHYFMDAAYDQVP